MKRWLDRQIVGGIGMVGFLVYAVWSVVHMPDREFWKVAVFVAILSLVSFFGLRQVRPHVRYGPHALVVKNSFCAFDIPWRGIRKIEMDQRTGLTVIVSGRNDAVIVEAFSGWPGFGRLTRVRDELEAARRQYADGASLIEGDTVVERPSRGFMELALALPIVVAVLSVLIEGALALFS
ncbi:hypothetical protein [Streptomyces sp. 061-3]|uniref:hypothetical protein n=1 Tax=Streptomyces sp. 061-3 TaxID=2789268 RepID=UPI003980BA2A